MPDLSLPKLSKARCGQPHGRFGAAAWGNA